MTANIEDNTNETHVPVWPLVLLILLTLAPIAVVLYDTVQDMEPGTPLMRAVNDPGNGGAAKVYAFIIGMLLWLVTIPLTAIYSIVLIVSRIAALLRRRRAQKRGDII